MEWNRTHYLDYMSGRRVDRSMFVELFGPLVGLDDEWREQGAREAEVSLEAFGFDYVRRIAVPVNHGYWPTSPEETLSEDAEYKIVLDGMGRRVKLPKGKATIPLPLEYPVQNEADWLAIKPRYEFSDRRFESDWEKQCRDANESDTLVVAAIVGGYDQIRQLMGDEEACVSFYTQPELIRDMLQTFELLNQRILSALTNRVRIDQLSVHEDFAGKSGPLLGPNLMDEFIAPYYRAAWELVSSGEGGAQAEIFQLDSDGDITPIVDSLLGGGVNSILPNEPAAGMDIVSLRSTYGGRMRLVGGIDKFAVRTSREAIDAELDRKIVPELLDGGVVFGLDHRIPNGTPIDLYRYYVSEARKRLGLEPNPEPGWARMAF